MESNYKETQLLTLQIYASFFFIIAVIISIILTYNNILKRTQNKSLFSNQSENTITLLNRIALTIIAIIFTYINYGFFKISQEKNKGTSQKEEFIASILTLIAAFILLYTTVESIINNTENTNSDTPLI